MGWDDTPLEQLDDDPPRRWTERHTNVAALFGLVALVVAIGYAAGAIGGLLTQSRDAAVEAALKKADGWIVEAVHRRQRGDSLARIATATARAAERQRVAFEAARSRLTPTRTTDTVAVVGLPPVRGGWGGVVVTSGDNAGADTLPTPRLVIRELVLRDSVIDRADAVIAKYRLAYGRADQAVTELSLALRASDSARVELQRAVDALRAPCRVLGLLPCPSRALTFGAGVVLGAVTTTWMAR